MSKEQEGAAEDHIKGGPFYNYGWLRFATKREYEDVQQIERVIRDYLAVVTPKRPLCIGVFGPPGSGKSFGVKAIRDTLKKNGIELAYHKINLTQATSTEELAGELAAVKFASELAAVVPMVFFDEFDAALDGAALGWLSWFLAPMEDGEFVCLGRWVKLPRAIFVFGGGTAHRAAEFGARDPGRFRAAKGPDFVSRLRAFVDVLGPNDGDEHERRRRRALSIDHQLDKELDATADAELLEDLLNVGRYRHGNRSIGAVLELAARGRDKRADGTMPLLSRTHLPPEEVLALHVDSGPLDSDRIGGAIGLSCDFEAKNSGEAMKALSRELWRQGARLAYYRANADSDAFTWGPTVEARAQPLPLSQKGYTVRRVEVFAFGDFEVPEAWGPYVVIVPGQGRTGSSDPARMREELFHMRWLMNSRCVARVLVEGRTALSEGRRIQGILEEAMLALATGQPVYVLGGFGGAARCLGAMLGLATAPIGESLMPSQGELPEHIATLGGALDLPKHAASIPEYLASFAIGGRRWPDNGLSVEENRELFAITVEKVTDAASVERNERAIDKLIGLIRRGLLRRFGP